MEIIIIKEMFMLYRKNLVNRLLVILALAAFLGIALWQSSGKHAAVTANSSTARPKTIAQSGKVTTVSLDISPGAKSKTLNLGAQGNLAVAVLSTSGFDAKTINPATLRFAGAPIVKLKAPKHTGESRSSSTSGNRFNISFEDVNGDHRADLIARFAIPFLAELSAGTHEAVLSGKAFDGTAVWGAANVQAYGASLLRAATPNGIPGFCNSDPITINDGGSPSSPQAINTEATPYPSTIDVSGLSGFISSLTVSINGFSHSFASDVSVLLVGPTGQKMILFAQASDGSPVSNASLAFSDDATAYLPIDAAIVTGIYKPTNRTGNNEAGEVDFPAPAPSSTPDSPYAATLAAFQGSDPNGIWSLYVVDNASGDSGEISGGWCLTINTSDNPTTCKSTLLQGSLGKGDATQVDRLTRDIIPSECVGTAKTCPGAFGGSDTLLYDSYTLTNQNNVPACVTVTTTSGCGDNILASAYLTSYTPPPPGSNLCTSYLADAGVSPNASNGVGNAFSFTVPAGATFVLVVNEIADTGCEDYSLLVEGNICPAAQGGSCFITCPANITVANDPNQCSAVVSYPAPTTTGTCGTITCTPPSGSLFPVGNNPVTCTEEVTPGAQRPLGDGGPPTCNFLITVNDTQPPVISDCPSSVTAVATPSCPASTGTVVNFNTPTATDNCPGVTVACVPPSGAPFPPGTTTVTCTATDASGNTASCSFSVKTFNVAIQDRANPNAVLAWNTSTGQYIFCCNGSVFAGVGKVKTQGCTYTLDHTAADRRVLGSVNMTNFTGSGSLQSPAGTIRCSISDNDVRNNTYTCLSGGSQPTVVSR
jgi:subtilisin-like proprotein convertase family protein